jgi:hypothetical protein
MFLRKSLFTCAVLLSLAGAAFSSPSMDGAAVPLIVDKGIALQLHVANELRLREGGAIQATVIEPVYAFDREVIPAGTKVEGRITGVVKPGKLKRLSSFLIGNFKSAAEPQITFHNGWRSKLQCFRAPQRSSDWKTSPPPP